MVLKFVQTRIQQFYCNLFKIFTDNYKEKPPPPKEKNQVPLKYFKNLKRSFRLREIFGIILDSKIKGGKNNQMKCFHHSCHYNYGTVLSL